MSQTVSKAKQVELTDKHIEVMENFERLLESGIANQTMSDIASTLKVSLRTLYEIAPSKEELIISTIDRILTNTAKQAFSAIKDVSSPMSKLRLFTEIGNEAVGPKTKKFEVDLRKIKGAQQMIDFHQNAYIRQINKLLQEAIKANEIELIDTQAVAMILGGIAQEYSKPEIVMQLNQSPEVSANMITDLIIRGLLKGLSQLELKKFYNQNQKDKNELGNLKDQISDLKIKIKGKDSLLKDANNLIKELKIKIKDYE